MDLPQSDQSPTDHWELLVEALRHRSRCKTSLRHPSFKRTFLIHLLKTHPLYSCPFNKAISGQALEDSKVLFDTFYLALKLLARRFGHWYLGEQTEKRETVLSPYC